jgi:uncharacterized membrane protein
MNKAFRFLAMCVIGVAFATLSVAWAQTYTTLDFPGATSTLLGGGPNPQGTIVGQETTAGVSHGFTYKGGVFKVFDPPGSTLTLPNFIADDGTIGGQFLDASQVTHGFLLYRGHYTIFNVPGAAGTGLSGLNPSGEMTGFTCLKDPTCEAAPYESFTVSNRGVITRFNPPGAISSFASAVNPRGEVVGTYTDNSGVSHGYVLYHGKFVTNNFPDSTFTFNGGVNPQGNIVGFYTDTSNVSHSFLLSDGEYTGFDPPGATFSDAAAINDCGIIVGFYLDSANVVHGYIRMP